MTRLISKKMTETALKGQIKDYLAYRGIFNYPLLQGLGAKRGLPDRVMHLNGRVIYLELKLPTGKLSEGQLEFQAQCEEDGIGYFVIRSIEDMEKMLG